MHETSNARDDRTTVILAPYAERYEIPGPVELAPRLGDVAGRTIGLIDNTFPAIRVIHAELRRQLGQVGCSFTTISKKYWQGIDDLSLRAFADSADAFVSGLCNTPPSTRWNIRESVALERHGKPTVTLVTAYYDLLAAEIARSEGMPGLRRITLPHPIERIRDATLDVLAGRLVHDIIEALTSTTAPETVIVDIAKDARPGR